MIYFLILDGQCVIEAKMLQTRKWILWECGNGSAGASLKRRKSTHGIVQGKQNQEDLLLWSGEKSSEQCRCVRMTAVGLLGPGLQK